MVQLYSPYHLLHQFLPCTQSRPRSLLVTPVLPLSIHQLVKHSAGHSSTCSNGRSFLLSIGFHPRSSFLGPFIRHSLGSYHWSSFLVPNLEPVLCLSHLSHPLSLHQLVKHSAGQHVQMVAAFCFWLGFIPETSFWALLSGTQMAEDAEGTFFRGRNMMDTCSR